MHVAGVLYIASEPYLPAVSSLYCLTENGAFHHWLCLVGSVPDTLRLIANNLGVGVGPAHIALNGIVAHIRVVY